MLNLCDMVFVEYLGLLQLNILFLEVGRRVINFIFTVLFVF